MNTYRNKVLNKLDEKVQSPLPLVSITGRTIVSMSYRVNEANEQKEFPNLLEAELHLFLALYIFRYVVKLSQFYGLFAPFFFLFFLFNFNYHIHKNILASFFFHFHLLFDQFNDDAVGTNAP